MKLIQLSKRVWYYPYEEDRDRPNLGYILGDNWALAIDAGHSAEHTEEFYRAIQEKGLPLPSFTVLTHWHWDHTLGMHATSGLCIANSKTNEHLQEFRDMLEEDGVGKFFQFHESIRKEYSNGKEVTVKLADIVFENELELDAGNCPIRLVRTESPHTDDSTLVYVVNDRTLFIGDSDCGEFPGWTKDRDKCDSLIKTLDTFKAECVVEGHWIPDSIKGVIEEILS